MLWFESVSSKACQCDGLRGLELERQLCPDGPHSLREWDLGSNKRSFMRALSSALLPLPCYKTQCSFFPFTGLGIKAPSGNRGQPSLDTESSDALVLDFGASETMKTKFLKLRSLWYSAVPSQTHLARWIQPLQMLRI